MKLRLFLALFVLFSIPLSLHSEGWLVFGNGWKAHRKAIIKQSVLYGRENYSALSTRVVAERTALILDTWYKYRDTKMKHIKDPEVAVALAWTESALRMDAVSKTHDKGVMQVSYPTAKYICGQYKIPFNKDTANRELGTDSAYNVMVGLCELDNSMRSWNQVNFAILGYKVGYFRLAHLLQKGRLTKHYLNLYAKVDVCCQFLTTVPSSFMGNRIAHPTNIICGFAPSNFS